MEASTGKSARTLSFIDKLATGKIVLVLAVAAVAAFVIYIKRGERIIAEERKVAISMADASKETRSELLALYKQRVLLAESLLKSLGAPPLSKNWTRSEYWKVATPEDLASLDSDQNLISNHIARYLSKIQMYSGNPTAKQDLKMENVLKQSQSFEQFEQTIVRKRREYYEMAETFRSRFQKLRKREKLKDDPDFSNGNFPLFPAESALQRKGNAK
jgi:hypothetical protein